jgi:hypothetical protein
VGHWRRGAPSGVAIELAEMPEPGGSGQHGAGQGSGAPGVNVAVRPVPTNWPAYGLGGSVCTWRATEQGSHVGSLLGYSELEPGACGSHAARQVLACLAAASVHVQ